jgi:hypothetical protein
LWEYGEVWFKVKIIAVLANGYIFRSSSTRDAPLLKRFCIFFSRIFTACALAEIISRLRCSVFCFWFPFPHLFSSLRSLRCCNSFSLFYTPPRVLGLSLNLARCLQSGKFLIPCTLDECILPRPLLRLLCEFKVGICVGWAAETGIERLAVRMSLVAVVESRELGMSVCCTPEAAEGSRQEDQEAHLNGSST